MKKENRKEKVEGHPQTDSMITACHLKASGQVDLPSEMCVTLEINLVGSR